MRKIVLVMISFIMTIVLSGCGDTTKVTSSAQDYYGMDYETVVSKLEDDGFTNITVEMVEDLSSSSDLNDGEVGEVSIDGDTDFKKKTEFAKDASIIITYHTIKKIAIPLSSNDIQNYDYNAIAQMFTNDGFTRVTAEEVYDLDPDITTVEFENEVSINGKTSFEKGGDVPFDASISVICHKPFKKYNIKLHIDFIPNILFSRYDVRLMVDNEEKHVLEHGVDGEYEFTLKEGSYTFSFVNKESSSVKGEVTYNVNSNIDAYLKISCNSSNVSVEEEFVDRNEPLAENEVKITCDKYEFTGKNYKDVVSLLKDFGFTNIKEVPLYDIILGWTDEGSVDNVTIGGVDNYKLGDVLNADAEVIVTYHLYEKDDPSKIKVTVASSSYIGLNYSEVKKTFTDMGFSNIKLESSATANLDSDGEVSQVKIGGFTFNDGETFDPDEEVLIKYYVYDSSLSSENKNVDDSITTLTVENCPDLAALLLLKDPSDSSVNTFASTYKGKVIEFDGCVHSLQHHGDYNTRFDILIGAGNFDANSMSGPNFRLTDVGAYNLGFSSLALLENEIPVGTNIHIIAEVNKYDPNTTFFELDVISVVVR